MHIEHLRIENLKLLRRFELSFLRAGKPRPWTVIVGENGLCKTSILRAIALATSGYVRANQLADVPSLADRRLGTGPSGPQVKVDAHLERNGAPIRSMLVIEPGHTTITAGSWDASRPGPFSADVLVDARAKNDPGWFVAGYGTSRILPRPYESERSEDLSLSRLLSLFDRGRVIGTGFADILEDTKPFAKALQSALVDGGLLPSALNVELRGRGGVRSASDLIEASRFEVRAGRDAMKVPATWLSQGQQTTIAWIADLIGQQFLDAGHPVDTADMRGIVLIDELDLHLHPRWQVDLISKLKNVFPQLQFVATTHSPMVLPGLEQDEIVMLESDDEGSVLSALAPETPALLTGTEIYRDFFGVENLHPSALGDELRRYGFLVGNAARSPDEESEMVELQKRLKAAGIDPGWTPVSNGSL